MNCRKFKSNHVGFIDDVLSAADMADMRRHMHGCSRCGTLDVRIRRSLMVVRSLPQIEPSADFYFRLNQALKQAPAPTATRQPVAVAATFVAVTAALAAAVYFAMAVGVDRQPSVPRAGESIVAVVTAASGTSPISDAALAAAVPAGVPVWPAMFMVSDLPMQMANAELLDHGFGR